MILLLVACQASETATPVTYAGDPGPDTCGTTELQGFVGGPLATFSATNPDQSNLRVIKQGQIVTSDYKPKRINVLTDPVGNKILAITCG